MSRLCIAWFLIATACGGRVVNMAKPALSPPPPAVDFGKVPVLNEVTKQVEVISVGRVDLVVANVSLRDGTGAFRLVNLPPEKIGPGNTERIGVAFTPAREAMYSDVLRFNTDDEMNPAVEVQLTGEGSTKAQVRVEPERLQFGVVNECATGVAQLAISSVGSADLVVEEIAFTNDSAPGFAFVGSTRTPATVKTTGRNGLMERLELTVRYTAMPGVSGAVNGTIRLRTTDPERREVLVPVEATINRAPIATVAPLGNGAPGLTINLDGSGSSDPEGDTPLTYRWTLRSKPLASTTTIADPMSAMTSMRLDANTPGEYEAQLEVTDARGAKSCQPARARVVAAPAEKLRVELFWDNVETDLDLHVIRTPTSAVFEPPDDCFFQNRKPDWGVAGNTMDDPELTRDALRGYGPEVFGYVNPIEGTFRVVVVLQNDLLSTRPASRATVRIYQFGVLKAEVSRTLARKGDLWAVGDITWPSGDVQVLP